MTSQESTQNKNEPTIQPSVRVADIAAAIPVYEAVGFEKIAAFPMPDGNLAHAILRLGNTPLHLAPLGYNPQDESMDEAYENQVSQGPRGLGVTFYAKVEDVDAFFKTVQGADGWTTKSEPETMFYGDRTFWGFDPFGYAWSFSTTVKEMTPEEMQAAMDELTASNPTA